MKRPFSLGICVPQPYGARLPSLFLIPLFSLFTFFSFSVPFLFFFFLYIPPSCAWQWLHFPGPISLKAHSWQHDFLPVLHPPRSANPISRPSLRTSYCPRHSLCKCVPKCLPYLPGTALVLSAHKSAGYVGKLFENIVLARILREVSERGPLHDEQFGFRPKHSTTLQLARVGERVIRNFGKRG